MILEFPKRILFQRKHPSFDIISIWAPFGLCANIEQIRTHHVWGRFFAAAKDKGSAPREREREKRPTKTTERADHHTAHESQLENGQAWQKQQSQNPKLDLTPNSSKDIDVLINQKKARAPNR